MKNLLYGILLFTIIVSTEATKMKVMAYGRQIEVETPKTFMDYFWSFFYSPKEVIHCSPICKAIVDFSESIEVYPSEEFIIGKQIFDQGGKGKIIHLEDNQFKCVMYQNDVELARQVVSFKDHFMAHIESQVPGNDSRTFVCILEKVEPFEVVKSVAMKKNAYEILLNSCCKEVLHNYAMRKEIIDFITKLDRDIFTSLDESEAIEKVKKLYAHNTLIKKGSYFFGNADVPATIIDVIAFIKELFKYPEGFFNYDTSILLQELSICRRRIEYILDVLDKAGLHVDSSVTSSICICCNVDIIGDHFRMKNYDAIIYKNLHLNSLEQALK